MNRTDSLRWSLSSWLERPEIDEIVIVDWSSKVPIYEELQGFGDLRLRFVRVEDQTFWCAARCHNVEILMARSEALLRIDSDVRLMPEFFDKHPLTDGKSFWNLDWQKATCDEDRHLAGTIYSKRENFLLVKGYNEHLVAYGYEDDDLYIRLQEAGIVHKQSDRSQLQHLPHSDDSRLAQITPHVSFERNAMGGIGCNHYLSMEHPWSHDKEHMTNWDVEQVSERLTYCRKVT
jgi:hypothetical protein